MNKFEAGGNYYLSRPTPKYHTHTIGTYCALTGIFAAGNYYIGQQIGMNYHFTEGNTAIAFRISPSFENNFDHDMRVGSDFGISFLGLFVYAGYYKPVSSYESPYITRWRFGIRFVLNQAPAGSLGLE